MRQGLHRLNAKRTRQLRAALLARHGNRCWVCSGPFDPSLDGTGKPGAVSIKHVVPLSEGGTHDFNNLRLAHRGCNRPPIEQDRPTLVLVPKGASDGQDDHARVARSAEQQVRAA